MNDQKLKIRIQLPQQTQSVDQPQSIDDLNPMTKKPDETDNPPFDRQKILLALLLTGFIVGLISYLIIWWNDEGLPLTEIDPVITTHENITPPIDPSLDELAVIEVDDKTVDLALSENETVVDQSTPEITNKTDLTPEPEQNAEPATNATDNLDETTFSTANSLISNTLEDQPQIMRAQLTSAINQREPVDIIDYIWLNQGATQQVFFFIQLRDLAGQRVSVHWHYQDEVVAKVPLTIGSNNWRTYASKLLRKNRLGAWRVTLHDQSGKLLSQRNFTVGSRS